MSSSHRHSTRAYFFNIAWSWLGVAALLVATAVFTPILIRRLGATQFGIWALAVSLVEYFWMIDLGFRPATVKLSAEFRALDQSENLSRLVNTALVYSFLASVLVLGLAWPNAHRLGVLFHIQNDSFAFLVRVVGLSWAGGLISNIFGAALEGAQRFDLSNRASIVSTVLRGGLSVAFVLNGYGLRQMGIALLFAQGIGYGMTYFYFRRTHPDLRLSPFLVSWSMTRRIIGYTRQILPGILGQRLSQGAIPSVIAMFQPVQFVTYYTQSQRMMEYAADAISRVGFVTAPRASDWHARGDSRQIVTLTLAANRYCLTLWGVWASYLLVYGANLCRVWINPDFGNHVAPLLPLFLCGYTLWMGQFVSAAVLMGIGRYTGFGATLLIEALASVAVAALLLPRFGVAGAVAGLSACMIVSRFAILSYLFSKEFGISQAHSLLEVFGRPLTLIGVSSAALLLCREWWPGTGWLQLAVVGFIFALAYAALALWFVVQREHRQFVFEKILDRWRGQPVTPERGL
jgi:O-antigen/teichoic acid export membrane protein